MDADVVHAQVVITQGQSLFEGLVDLHLNALRLMLTGEAKKVLHDPVCALRLLVKLVGILNSLLAHLSTRGQQLAVAKDGG